MFGRRMLFSFVILLFTITFSPAQKKAPLADLSWLSGCWDYPKDEEESNP